MTLRTISWGGGVQSTALCVLATQGKLDDIMGGPVDAALFSNVGDDSEHPATLRFVREVAIPWLTDRGLPAFELQRVRRDGTTETLVDRLLRDGSKSIPIPLRMPNGAPTSRSCTVDWKINVVRKWLKQHGASKADPAVVAIGISTDELERANPNRAPADQRLVYPLLQLGLNRSDCIAVIRAAGLVVPPKSSCFFCPFHRPLVWSEMRRDEPDLFWQAVKIERLVNEKQVAIGNPPKYLTGFGRPLDEAISEAQETLPGLWGVGEDGCDEGYCWT